MARFYAHPPTEEGLLASSGEVRQDARVRAQVEAAGLRDRISILGFVDDLPAAMAALPLGVKAHVVGAFVLIVVLGGSNAVAIRFSNAELPPFWGAAIRFIPAAFFYWIVVFARRIGFPEASVQDAVATARRNAAVKTAQVR